MKVQWDKGGNNLLLGDGTGGSWLRCIQSGCSAWLWVSTGILCTYIYTVQLTICILKSDLCKIQLVPYHPRYKFCISQRVLVRTLLNCREHLVKHSAITTIITTLPSYGQLSERWIFFLTYKQLVIMFYCCCRGNYHSYIWHRYPRLLGCWEWRHTCQVQDWLVTIS